MTNAGYTEVEALAVRDRLERRGMRPLDATGDSYIIDGHDFLVKVAASETNDVAYHLMNLVGTPSLPEVLIVRVFTKAIATLARRAMRREAVAAV
jgi:hypothetical protein